ncbi:MarR family winged helix-turn-helix transcriptional regulator [Thermonema rossianum]|uniref:MarR family winged helix-turn-helix transcriptional regulator n=1 Tax=Thermonema rossianum TaxID=55505 RepID=UPI00056F0D65|nr:MarR family transcriptional regulator [Thermonema rossianum]
MIDTKVKLPREETIDYNIKTAWHAIARMYNAEAVKYGITTSIGYILLNIDEEEGTPATKIAPLFGLEARSITRTLKKMEEDGLIMRKQDEVDRRYVRICLTPKGREKKEVARRVVRQFNFAVRERVPAEKLQVFFEVIRTVMQVVDEFSIQSS